MDFIASIQNVIKKYYSLSDPINVAVSGGADSVALLRALHTIGMPCTAVHINHKLRNKDSDNDQKFVTELAYKLNIPIITHIENASVYAKKNNISIEMAGREIRHGFFQTLPIKTIALGHHANDQAENFLMKASRGAGLDGLGGMSRYQQIESISLIRPFLHLSHDEICHWLVQNNWKWREDKSNTDTDFIRNRIRHQILPMMREELNPDITNTLNRSMHIIREENEWLEKSASKFSDQTIKDAPLVLRRRWVRSWLHKAKIKGINFEVTDQIAEALGNLHGTHYHDVNHEWKVAIEYGIPVLVPQQKQEYIQNWVLHTEVGKGWKKDHGQGAGILPAEASLSASKVMDFPLKIRSIKPGDRFHPLGMNGHRKLQDILTDQKIPKRNRPAIPVVTCNDNIVWVPGFRIASGWEVPKKQANSVHLRIICNET